MPELPEVQVLADDLQAADIIGHAITAARVYWPKTIATSSPQTFRRRIKDHAIATIGRRGKFLVFGLTPASHLLIHLRMSGRLHLVATGVKRSKHEHVVLNLDNGRQIRFHDTRKFGRMYLTQNTDRILGHLGVEPLDPGFNVRLFKQMLGSRKRQLKPLLLDQTFVAGLGNIYVDEALWDASIHPQRLASTLSQSEINALHRAIPKVLKRGIQNLGTSLGTGRANFYSVARRKGRNQDQLNVFRRTGLPCPRCQTPLERIVVAQRSTHICPKCQG